MTPSSGPGPSQRRQTLRWQVVARSRPTNLHIRFVGWVGIYMSTYIDGGLLGEVHQPLLLYKLQGWQGTSRQMVPRAYLGQREYLLCTSVRGRTFEKKPCTGSLLAASQQRVSKLQYPGRQPAK